ncbi:MAG: hypothetical protein WAW39_22505 [Prosthecobacter sp.]|uniref:hypothetical protein n=1 Tax=Prosthecobacter sp. TaxID=1965333 RepID=UPI003BB1939E
MSHPTHIEREYYQKLVGRQVLSIHLDELEGPFFPVLVLSDRDRDGQFATIMGLADPEGNSPKR